VLREGLVRLDHLPLVSNVAGLPALARGARVDLHINAVDPWSLTLEAAFAGIISVPEEMPVAGDEENPDNGENSD